MVSTVVSSSGLCRCFWLLLGLAGCVLLLLDLAIQERQPNADQRGRDALNHHVNARNSTSAVATGIAPPSVGRPFPTAVLHVGPPKTGTTSIQHALTQRQYLHALAADNYAVPSYTARNHMRVTFCAADDNCRGKGYSVWNSAVRSYRTSREVDRTNVIFSCEVLAYFSNTSAFDALEEMLGDYQLHVVVVYRRFYDWLHSYYGETRNPYGMKQNYMSWDKGKRNCCTGRLNRVLDNTNIVTWLQGKSVDVLYNFNYAATVYQNLARRYGDDHVTLLNFHDGDVLDSFFCNDAGLRSPSACELLRSSESTQDKQINKGVPTIYDELAIGAYDRGFLAPPTKNRRSTRERGGKGRARKGTDENSVVTRPEAREAIRYHHEVVLNRTSEDFARICLPTETMNHIHQLSLEAERMLMPEFFKSTRGEHVLQSDFESRSRAMFCSVDVDSVLKESTWKEFFLGLVESRINFGKGGSKHGSIGSH